MAKIIIHNESSGTDDIATIAVAHVLSKGFVSGENQYCWVTTFVSQKISVLAMKTNGNTHTFKVRDEQLHKGDTE